MNTTADPLGLHQAMQMIQQGVAANWPLAVIGLAGLFGLYILVYRR